MQINCDRDTHHHPRPPPGIQSSIDTALRAHFSGIDGGAYAQQQPSSADLRCQWTLSGRVKSLPSTFRKVFRQGKDPSSVLDLLAVRLIVTPSPEDGSMGEEGGVGSGRGGDDGRDGGDTLDTIVSTGGRGTEGGVDEVVGVAAASSERNLTDYGPAGASAAEAIRALWQKSAKAGGSPFDESPTDPSSEVVARDVAAATATATALPMPMPVPVPVPVPKAPLAVASGTIADWDDPEDDAGIDLCWEAHQVILSCLGAAATAAEREARAYGGGGGTSGGTSGADDTGSAINAGLQEWGERRERFKDYLTKPKPNGYQSLHLVLQHGVTKHCVELQIRSQAMHQEAEFGFASHDFYKGGLTSAEDVEDFRTALATSGVKMLPGRTEVEVGSAVADT